MYPYPGKPVIVADCCHTIVCERKGLTTDYDWRYCGCPKEKVKHRATRVYNGKVPR